MVWFSAASGTGVFPLAAPGTERADVAILVEASTKRTLVLFALLMRDRTTCVKRHIVLTRR